MRKKINKYNKYQINNKKIISQILLKYFSKKSGNDNPILQKEINDLINKLKNSGLRIT